MKKTYITVLCLSSVLLSGCIAFDVGEPQRWTIDRGPESKVVITRQKKMSLGFFPAEAESLWKPAGAIKPLVGWKHKGNGMYSRQSDAPLARYLVLGWISTPWSLLVTPWHGDYYCDSHHWYENNVELIRLFPYDVQSEIHVNTWKGGRGDVFCSNLSHSSLIGCHRYATVVIEEMSAGEEEVEDDEED